MSIHKGKIIRELYSAWPKNTLATSKWLESLGISRQLRYRYVKSGWLQSMGVGVYVRPGDTVSWKGALFALQKQLDKKIHIGGKTALELMSMAHYVPFNLARVFLFSSSSENAPKWFREHSWDVELVLIGTNLLPLEIGIGEETFGDFTLQISEPERAAIEVVSLIGKHHSFDEIFLLSQNFSRLRPTLVQKLLESCNSYRTKRLFLLFGDHHQHVWFQKIDLTKINLGKGVIQIGETGTYIRKYNMVIPKELREYEGI